MYSLSASAEFRAAEAAARSAGERVERSVADADADERVADETRSSRDVRERSDSIANVAVDAVPSSFLSPETLAEKGVERVLVATETKTAFSRESDEPNHFSARRVFRLRVRDVEDVSALVVSVDASASTDASSSSSSCGDPDFVTRVFLCAATRTKKKAPLSDNSPETDGAERRTERACFLLRAKTRLTARGGTGATGEKRTKTTSHRLDDFETDLEPVVSRRVAMSNVAKRSFAFGDDASAPWVAAADFDPAPARREKDSVGVRVFSLDGSSSPGAFLATPFAVTRVAASRGGEWLVACGARGVCALWRGEDVREALRRRAASRIASPSGTGEAFRASETDDFPPLLLAAPRYGGVAPRGDAPDVLAFADDGRTLFAAHDGALFATWTLTEEEKELSRDAVENEINANARETRVRLETRGVFSWRPRGVSYSTRETMCDGAAHVFGEASDEETERDDPERPSPNRVAFESGAFSRKTRDRPSLLVALAARETGGATLERHAAA